MIKPYKQYSKDGELLYVGITHNIKGRMLGHKKRSRWFKEIHRVEAEVFSSRREAAEAKRKAINDLKPKYNQMGLAKNYWRDFLSDAEIDQLAKIEDDLHEAEDEQRALRRLLKSRAESRMRVAKRQTKER